MRNSYLGDDADTVAAIYGQLAGAYYGEEGIPASWRERLGKVRTSIPRTKNENFSHLISMGYQ
ncbi:ADP-ribosylglycohydrolase family protein [Aeromonas caviae]|uniref:ADP-ribosylglycohydrolase family protein n=1 Tax=Aeromonas caviae TaxID=648 RepID=UPI000D691B1E